MPCLWWHAQADVAAHVLIVLGLLHQHFHVGPHVSHALLHAAEGGGLAIAVLSTLAAATAEVLAMRGAHSALLRRAQAQAAAGGGGVEAHAHGAAGKEGAGTADAQAPLQREEQEETRERKAL